MAIPMPFRGQQVSGGFGLLGTEAPIHPHPEKMASGIGETKRRLTVDKK